MSEQEKAVNSSFFSKAMSTAADMAKNSAKSLLYLTAAGRKLKLIKVTGEKLLTLTNDAGDLIDMCRAYYKGIYKDVPYGTIVKSLGAVVYFAFIIDLVPDFIPFFGLLDDAAVVAWVINSIAADIERFRKWREKLPRYVDEETQSTETLSKP